MWESNILNVCHNLIAKDHIKAKYVILKVYILSAVGYENNKT